MEALTAIVGSFSTLFFIGTATLLLVWWYATRNHNYWKKRNIPFVKPLPFLGSLMDLFKKPLHIVEIERYNTYGKIYGHFEANRPILAVSDPAILRNILVKDFHLFTSRRSLESGNPIFDNMVVTLQGEAWKRVRTIITPTFTTGKIKRMMGIFTKCAQTCVKNYTKFAESGEPAELKNLYGAFTMDVIASTAFSTKLDSHNDPSNKFVAAAKQVFTKNISWRAVLLFLAPSLLKIFRISLFPPNVLQFFKDITLEIIEERKRTGQVRNDFLQLLMDTAEEVEDQKNQKITEHEDLTSNYGKDFSGAQIFKNVSNKRLSPDELVAQCVIFFLAGYDTTASTLAFASYLLALNPDVQEKLIAEIDKALSAPKEELTYETLQNMKYLDNVISETLRLYPAAPRLERVADEEYKIENEGITIPKGMLISIPICGIQRDPEYFPDPEKFDPDRFTPEERASRDQYVYMPFGMGPRNCIGMRFALIEIKVCLVLMLSNFRFKRSSATKVPLEFYTGQNMQPKEMMVGLEQRTDGFKA
ncbi:cytochrome P450 3A8-like [Uloborus diversus]|uniref:cytochrome P450 3A8-like n=1 Tax=Uloborus diversus TaxID=327109 RepID=UPI00240A1A5C|nr:cytochrome P450 3A8-like [Uloborus diversus]